jgi:hypothetical protein
MFNNWIAISWEAARLGWEAQSVITLRKLAMGGAPSRVEAQRMVQEKIAAVGEAVTAAASAAASACSPSTAARKVLRVYKKRVRSNKRRLFRSRPQHERSGLQETGPIKQASAIAVILSIHPVILVDLDDLAAHAGGNLPAARAPGLWWVGTKADRQVE